MKICIGLLAHNEEDGIARTLSDLLSQDLWAVTEHRVEMIVVVNGSWDRTADIARETLAASSVSTQSRVEELEKAGKGNAWNRLVHEFSRADCGLLILVDADIRIPQAEALRTMVETLIAAPDAAACVDEPRKDFDSVRMNPLMRRLSASASRAALRGPPKLCGQLYAARAEALRDIFLPEPLLVEDGFIKAMLVTNGFREAEQPARLVRAPGIYHLYEPEPDRRAVFKHEKRILIGTLCNYRLFELAREQAETGIGAGEWMRAETARDPDWFRAQLARRFRTGSPHLREVWTFVFAPLRSIRPSGLRALPSALIRVLVSLPVGWAARADLRRGEFQW